jgi:putative transposase
VAFLCRRYGVSRSGFYAWDARERSRRSHDDEQLRARIERIHRDSRGRYGSPRVHQQLKREGVRCSNKRVARLMREQGLRARVSSLYRCSTGVHRFFTLGQSSRACRSLLTHSSTNARTLPVTSRVWA